MLSWTANIKAFTEKLLDPEAFDDQRVYIRSTKKPPDIPVKNWVKRIKVIYGYLPLIEVGGAKFMEQEIIRD